MPDAYRINVTVAAEFDLDYYPAATQKMIAKDIQVQLSHEPTWETRNRKKLQGHPLASWELRCEGFRVFYEVDEEARVVRVVAAGHKDRNKLIVRGKQVKV